MFVHKKNWTKEQIERKMSEKTNNTVQNRKIVRLFGISCIYMIVSRIWAVQLNAERYKTLRFQVLFPNNSLWVQFFFFNADNVKIFNDSIKVLIYHLHVQIYTKMSNCWQMLGFVFFLLQPHLIVSVRTNCGWFWFEQRYEDLFVIFSAPLYKLA